ncbi:hypothetical protein [Halorhabdus rudnickae]|uniref:hypothetical protein n=1 Tax=Halorhabdus rudnickae TaxID=1775544 RepID=UPI001084538C|nr:hypothetical protein [Halorhabdus rudnickae]
MDVLPWLLDWPPSRGTVAVFVLLSAFSVGTLVVLGGVTDEITYDNASIESTDFTVKLNDEITMPDVGSDSMGTCLASGTPGDRITVRGNVSVQIPTRNDRNAAEIRRVELAVSLAHTDERTTQTLSRTGDVTTDVFWVFEDDETLSVNDTATVQITLLTADSMLADRTAAVSVQNATRSYDC